MTTETTILPSIQHAAPVKIISASDKIALKVVEKIRSDRSSWKHSETSDETSTTRSYESVIGSAKISVLRKEVAGKKTRETIARAAIIVTPESGKTLTITGHLAARAWFVLTHAPKIRGTKEIDLEAIAAAEAALGL